MYYGGNTDLDLATMDTVELGFRTRRIKHVVVDAEAFFSVIKDFSYNVTTVNSGEMQNGTFVSKFESVYDNLDVKAEQYGLTAGVNFVPTDKLMTRLFGTVQYTELKDHSKDKDSEVYGTHTTIDEIKHDGTPLFYGGLDVSYRPFAKWNFNTNAYYYTGHRFRYANFTAISGENTDPVFETDAKLLWNAKIAWSPCKYFSAYVNIRNLLDDRSEEFAWSDEIGRTILGGVRFEL